MLFCDMQGPVGHREKDGSFFCWIMVVVKGKNELMFRCAVLCFFGKREIFKMKKVKSIPGKKSKREQWLQGHGWALPFPPFPIRACTQKDNVYKQVLINIWGEKCERKE